MKNSHFAKYFAGFPTTEDGFGNDRRSFDEAVFILSQTLLFDARPLGVWGAADDAD